MMHTVKNLKGEAVELDDQAYQILMEIRAKDVDREIPFEEGTVINYKAEWDQDTRGKDDDSIYYGDDDE